VEFWGGLHVGRKDLGVAPQVYEKSIACPLAFDFYNIERYIAEEILEGGPNANTVAIERCESRCPGCK